MAILCEEYDLLFVMVPGTGCSVVGLELTSKLNGKYLPETDIVVDGKVKHERKHNSLAELKRDGFVDSAGLENLLTFATVRNPLDTFTTYYQRIVGGWTDDSHAVRQRLIERQFAEKTISADEKEVLLKHLQRKARMTAKRKVWMKRLGFSNWALLNSLRLRWKNQKSRSELFPMLEGIDVAIRYEKLQDGFNDVLQHAGFNETIDLPRKNETQGKRPFMDYYAAPHLMFIRAALAKPLKEFGYQTSSDESLIFLDQQKFDRWAALRRPSEDS